MYNLLSFFSYTAERHTQTKKSVSLRLKRDSDTKNEHLGMCLCQAVAVNISVYKYRQMSTPEHTKPQSLFYKLLSHISMAVSFLQACLLVLEWVWDH